jgi:hypothetical protein
MKMKLYDIPIDSPLTDEKRSAIGEFIVENSVHSKTPVTHSWDEADERLLNIKTPPVVWEVFFHPGTVEVFGSGPAWAKLLLTKKRQQELRERLEEVLKATGFITA